MDAEEEQVETALLKATTEHGCWDNGNQLDVYCLWENEWSSVIFSFPSLLHIDYTKASLREVRVMHDDSPWSEFATCFLRSHNLVELRWHIMLQAPNAQFELKIRRYKMVIVNGSTGAMGSTDFFPPGRASCSLCTGRWVVLDRKLAEKTIKDSLWPSFQRNRQKRVEMWKLSLWKIKWKLFRCLTDLHQICMSESVKNGVPRLPRETKATGLAGSSDHRFISAGPSIKPSCVEWGKSLKIGWWRTQQAVFFLNMFSIFSHNVNSYQKIRRGLLLAVCIWQCPKVENPETNGHGDSFSHIWLFFSYPNLWR